ncbi:MAG: cell wall metabolism sensor histidine kinase WalK [Caloramator sp.]|uniref:sensor histidine kinase n=1 Tax=Caloramator sp. TaxID=1871330 RepID=UPI001D44DBB7|nr:HAMP domain-containing sensor histidine kinase [Caloramator sp.]MBZ4664585.1 cell wall metabolism sensor histidine kinase WalK [Caloramator sp.]
MVTIIKDDLIKNSVKLKLSLSYVAILTVGLLLVNIFVFLAIRKEYITERKGNIYLYQRTIADLAYEADLNKTPLFDIAVETISNQSNSRILVIDDKYIVKADSKNELIGKYYQNREVKRAFSGVKTSKLRGFLKNSYLSVATPILIGDKVKGVVWFLTPIDDIYNKIIVIEKRLFTISLFILAIVTLIGYFISTYATKPIYSVIDAIENMAEGNLKQRVEVIENDEIARLCMAFNEMNEKITTIDSERRQFVADASHELKSPLASINVLVESLISSELANKDMAMEFLQDIHSEIDRLSNIVNNLLELTKLEGSFGVKVEKFDLNDVCLQVVKRVGYIAKTKNVEIFYDGQSVEIEANRDNIFRALYNVVENAVKYSFEYGRVDFWVEKDSRGAIIHIKDHGVGIPEEDIPKIFERFYRVDKTRDRKTGGSGLGLSIVNEIIKKHNGTIEVKSRVGEGTEFIISIPYEFKG